MTHHAPAVGAAPRGSGALRDPSTLGAVLVAAAYAAWASGTAAFTVAADVAVALPSAAFAAALVLQARWPAARPWRRIARGAPARAGTAVPWVLAIAVLVAIELASYFHPGPRADYPTISWLLDTMLHARAAKATAWFAWLTGGWYLVRR